MLKGITTAFKWVVYIVIALLGLKLAFTVFTMVSTGLALATLAMWGVGTLVVGGIAVFLGFKLLGKKK